jgi:hypothetical protein
VTIGSIANQSLDEHMRSSLLFGAAAALCIGTALLLFVNFVCPLTGF